MPVVENLTLEAAVSDEFTDQLAELQASLLDIAQTAESVFPIDVDESGVESTISELETLDAAVSGVDDDVTIDVDRNVNDVGTALATEGGFPAVDLGSLDFDSRRDTPAVTGLVGGGTPASNFFARVLDGRTDIITGLEDLVTSANPETPFRAPFGEGRSALGDAEVGTALETLFDNTDADISDLGELLTTSANPETAFDEPFGEGRSATGEDVAELVTFLDAPDPTDTRATSGLNRDPVQRFLQRDGGPISRATSRISNLNFTIADFNQAFVALVPLTVALVGALPAAITGLAALGVAAVGAAGGLAALGGLAIFGAGLGPDGEFSTENLQEEVDEIQEAFSEAFTPLARDLAPLVDESVNGIERLFNALAARGDVLRAFTDEARAFGSFLIDRIPVVASQLLGFAEALSPILGGIGEAFASRRFFRGLAELAASAIPPLVQIGTSIQNIIPTLIRLSTGFLVAFTTVVSFIEAIFILIDIVPFLPELLGFAASALLIYASAQTLALVATNKTLAKIAAQIKAFFVETFAALKASSATLTFANAARVAALAVGGLAVAVFTLVPALAFIGTSVGAISSQFGGLDGNVRSATDALRQFGKQSRRVDGASFSGPSAGTPTGVGSGASVQQTTVNVQTDGSTDDAFEASNTASFNTNT